MEGFWHAWAAREASQQWYIYSGARLSEELPEVVGVWQDSTAGVFRVKFENGDEMVVSPSCIARPATPVAADQPNG